MERLDPDTVRPQLGVPVFYLPLGDQYDTRAARPLVRGIRRHFPSSPIFGTFSPNTGHEEERLRAWLGEQASEVIFHDASSPTRPQLAYGTPTFTLTTPIFTSKDPSKGFWVEKKGQAYSVLVNPEQVKFDVDCPVTGEQRQRMRSEIGITDDHFAIVAGSLADPVITPHGSIGVKGWGRIHRRLAEENPERKIVSIIAPRLQSGTTRDAIRESFDTDKLYSLTGLREGKAKPPASGSYVVLVDTFGELPELYSIGNASFVDGNHNILEPAEHSVPLAYMRHNNNFPLSAPGLEKAGAGMPVSDEAELLSALERLIADPTEARRMGRRAKKFKEDHRGATDRLMETLTQISAQCQHAEQSKSERSRLQRLLR